MMNDEVSEGATEERAGQADGMGDERGEGMGDGMEADKGAEVTTTSGAAEFAALGLGEELCKALAGLGYEEPTPIQREAIPHVIAGRDVLGQAATGTGKTAAFALPMLQRLDRKRAAPGKPKALVLVPTRELAMQVAEAVHKYGRGLGASVLPIYGGQGIGQQLRALDRGVDVVVATPGRALDHLERGTLVFDDVRTVVLDEADEMLDMGFADELDAILSKLPEEHQTALFSATMSPRILKIAEQHLEKPVKISIERERTAPGTAPKVRQTAYIVQRAFKFQALGRVLDMEAPTSAIVFCRTRLEVDGLVEAMNARGYRAEALHGGFQQEQRDRVMKRFRSGSADLLIATDVAARGLDIEHISHVVNFDLPSEPEAYVHRIGRTGRAGREGVAITFLEPREHRMLRNIQRETGQKIAVATIPTVAELRNRRLELTGLALRETIVAGELDSFRGLVETLSSEFDPLDVAAAAAKLAHEANHAEVAAHDEEQDIPQEPMHERGPRDVRARWGAPDERRGPPPQWQDRGPRQNFERPPFERRGPPQGFEPDFGPDRGAPPVEGGERPQRAGFDRGERRPFEERAPQGGFGESLRIFIGAGRFDGLRPGDLVGAIANEAGLAGRDIGSIRIADRFSLVEVPAGAAHDVIHALRGTTIRGRRVNVRLDRDD